MEWEATLQAQGGGLQFGERFVPIERLHPVGGILDADRLHEGKDVPVRNSLMEPREFFILDGPWNTDFDVYGFVHALPLSEKTASHRKVETLRWERHFESHYWWTVSRPKVVN